ncbi:transposase [Paractinoplanes durhamensis]|uniref:transposase n=1 Tax=Paractinoplanes durhamensis TaxID=113563 RepID=UPI00362D6A2C
MSIELPPRSAHGPPGRLGQEKDREGRPYPDPLTLTPRGTNNKPPTSPNAAHQQRRAHPHVLTPNVVQHLTRFASARSVVKHAGLNPAENTSATFRGQTRLSRRGRPGLRLAAWRAVWGALPHNPVLHAKFTHLTRRDTDRLPPHRPAPRAPRPCCAGCTPSSPAGSRSTPTSPPASTVPAGPSPRWPPDDLTSGGSDATADNSINLPHPAGRARLFVEPPSS